VCLCRSPRGERGLKSATLAKSCRSSESLPPRGAWIEMRPSLVPSLGHTSSLPPRGVWIEISKLTAYQKSSFVAPLAGSVD